MDKFKLEFTNSRGETVELYDRPFRLMSVVGLGDVEATIQTQKVAYGDGSNLIDALLNERNISIELNVVANTHGELEELRSRLGSVFNPKLQLGTLRYISDTQVREIKALANTVPFMPDGTSNRSRTNQKVLIELVAPNPYWRSPIINSNELAAFVPLFEFPFEDEFEVGMEGHETVIENDSDVPIPIIVTVKGPTVNPKLTNITTGQMIRVKRELLAEDELVIDTDERTVLLNGVDVFPYIDLDTEFFSLAFGENVLKYTAESGTDTAILNIQTQQRYNAI